MLFTTVGDSATAVYAEEILDTPGVSVIYYLFWFSKTSNAKAIDCPVPIFMFPGLLENVSEKNSLPFLE